VKFKSDGKKTHRWHAMSTQISRQAKRALHNCPAKRAAKTGDSKLYIVMLMADPAENLGESNIQ